MLTSSILSMVLAGPPPVSYEQSRADLAMAADAIAEQSPADSIAQLNAVIFEATQHPHELFADPSAADDLARARLALAWAQLAAGDRANAAATMDLAIRSARTEYLPLAGLGPDIRKLHDQRRAALESAGRATIAVDCDGCEVLIDETRSDNPSQPLLLGVHRVWLFDLSDALEPRFEEITLDTAGGKVTLDYRPAPSTAATANLEPTPNPEYASRDATGASLMAMPTPQSDVPAHPRFKAPRWAKIVGMSVGASLLAAGGVMLSIDGKCQGGGSPRPDNVTDTCEQIWDHAAASYALLGVGGGVLVGATVWLAVDEARGGQRRTNAMVGWTMRF